MRNLVEYPVTQDEVIAVLVRAHHELYDPLAIGGLDGYILSMLTTMVKENPQIIERLFDVTKEIPTLTVSRSAEQV